MTATTEALKLAKFTDEIRGYTVDELLNAMVISVIQNQDAYGEFNAQITAVRNEFKRRLASVK